VVNPNREDDLSGLGHLCACGVVFMTWSRTLRLLRGKGTAALRSFDLLGCLDLVALATVCDVVPLKGLNRAFVVKGLSRRGISAIWGLSALARERGVIGEPLNPFISAS
jgi:single-stranded-DNA-specific exonuclease